MKREQMPPQQPRIGPGAAADAAASSPPAAGLPPPPLSAETPASPESTARLLAVAASAGSILWRSDGRGKMIGDGSTWSAFTGQAPGESAGEGWQRALHPDDRDAVVAAFVSGLESDEAFASDGRVRRRDGVYLRVLMRAIPDGRDADGTAVWAVACADVTELGRSGDDERNRARPVAPRQPAGEVAGHLGAVLDVLPAGVSIAGQNGELLHRNRAMREIWGEAAPLVGSVEEYGAYRAWWPDGTPVQPHEWALARAVRAGESVLNQEITVEGFDGRQRVVLNSAAPMRDGAGHIVGGVSSMQDITERKRAARGRAKLEARAYEADVRFKRLAASGIIGIVVADESRIFDANDAFLSIIGYTRDELEAGWVPWGKMTPPEYVARDAEGLRALLAEGELRPYEKELLRKDGERVPILTGAALVSRDPLTWMSFVLDITDRRRLEGALRDANARLAAATLDAEERAGQLEAILAALSDPLLAFDRTGRVTDANPAARALLALGRDPGFAAFSMDGRIAGAGGREPDGTAVGLSGWVLNRLLSGEVIAGTEAADVPMTALDGSERLISWTGAPVRDAEGEVTGAVAIGRDVTERRRLEHAVAERASQLQTIFNTMTDGMVLYDRDGRVLHMNAAFATLLGLDADPTLAQQAHRERGVALRHSSPEGEPLAHEDRPLSRVLRGEVLVGEKAMDVLFHTLDGRQVLLNCAGAPVLDEDGLVAGAVLVFRNVTEPRQLERERQAMLDVVTHDLRAPLTTARAVVQSVRRRLERAGHAEGQRLARIESGIDEMRVLVDDLQDAASLERGTLPLARVRCDLAAICREVAVEQTTATGRPVTLNLPRRRVWADADPTRLRQVIRNLLSNALKYSPAGRPVVLALARRRGAARLSVRDEGTGIPRAALPNLFTRYYRVPGVAVKHGPAKGVGLGLYIARRLVELHGGNIGVESSPGEGSTFWFTLPLPAPVSAQ